VATLRINRFLARCGLGSRRAVESLVAGGRVRVNGEQVRDLGRQVDPETDRVEVDGSVVRPVEVGVVLVLNKPVDVVSSLVRQDQRRCLTDLLPERWRGRRLFHVGRLDADSSGLLLLSDDGDLAQALTHPSHPVWKVYRVDVRPRLDEAQLRALADGTIVLDGRPVAPARARVLVEGSARCTLEIQLREGRNRQIRRMVEALGARVTALHRTAFGPIRLDDLAAGEIREASAAEMARLRELTDPHH
jgi:23S rRNA pseudouridine2605 synthase